MSKKVLVIGCGRLGYFYCLALKNISNEHKIVLECVDISDFALKKIKQLEDKDFHIEIFKTVENIKNNFFDIVVISTCSTGRYELATKTLQLFEVKNMILEKVIFEKCQQYSKFKKFIRDKKTDIYVNFTRRESDFYKEDKLKNCDMIITGKNWNLVSNISHFVDIFYFINSDLKPENSIIESNLLQISQKNREYFNDALGSLTLKNNNRLLTVVSSPGECQLEEIYISKNITIKLSEYEVSEIYESEEKKYKIDPIYVSLIMKSVLSRLFNNEKIFLPKYKDIYKQQQQIYKHIEEKGIKNIT